MVEGAETVAVTGTAVGLTLTGTTVQITDNDTAPEIEPEPLEVGIANATMREGQGNMVFVMRLDAPSEQPVSVTWTTGDETAAAGVDYTAVSAGRVTFASGETYQTIQVGILDDLMDEPDETFLVRLSDPVNAELAPAASTATGTILDDDRAPALTIGDASAMESDGEIVFLLTLSAESARTVSVKGVSANGTANAGEDYVEKRGGLTFEPGEIQKALHVTVLDDALDEPIETFMLNLSEATNARLAAEVVTATGTIMDDDPSVTVPWLARFGRTVTNQILEAVGERLSVRAARESEMTVGGYRVGGLEPTAAGEASAAGAASDRTMSGAEVLTTSSIRLAVAQEATGEPGAGGRWTVWGLGSAARFDGRDGDMAMDGDILMGMAGVDREQGAVLGGLVFTRSTGAGRYEDVDSADVPAYDGSLHAVLNSVHPYLQVAVSEHLAVWAVLGYGLGTLEQRTQVSEAQTGIGMLLGAVGTRVALPNREFRGVRLEVSRFRGQVIAEVWLPFERERWTWRSRQVKVGSRQVGWSGFV